jgi:uncharacterized protein (DUF924 family)
MDSAINDILSFWFGELDQRGLCDPGQHQLWFRKSDDTDRRCRTGFGDQVAMALAGELDQWAQSDRGLMALVLLLDQFTRNIYRDTPAAFAGDSRALELAVAAINSGRHTRLPAIHGVFLYLPLEHSENMRDQDRCVALLTGLADEVGIEQFQEFARYAEAHRQVIAQFGRFPHRNAILDRKSTETELAYLEKHGGF